MDAFTSFEGVGNNLDNEDYTENKDILCFNATMDNKGRVLVPVSVRRMLDISGNRCVSITIEPISCVKRFRIGSSSDISGILDSIDNVINYREDDGILEVTIGRGGFQ